METANAVRRRTMVRKRDRTVVVEMRVGGGGTVVSISGVEVKLSRSDD